MQVVAEFAARVAIVASEDKMNEVPEPVEPVIFQPNDQSTNDANEHLRKTESIVQNSILQVCSVLSQHQSLIKLTLSIPLLTH